MKLKKLIILILTGFITASFLHIDYYMVKYVYDGDTILLSNNDKARYSGIDTPEIDHKKGLNEYLALSSRNMNISLVKDKPVRLEFDREKRDRHGRLLVYAFQENGGMVNSIMVEHGLARVMATPPNLRYFNLLLECQRRAISDKLGIWKKELADNGNRYTGNKQSYRFHRHDCPFAESILPRNRVIFKTLHDAYWNGFSPCRECRPDKEPPLQ